MRITVLVADDHTIVREGLVTLLSAEPDIEVVAAAAGGREALALTLRLEPRVVILDISMPDIDGIETARQILERRPQTLVAILSMHSGAEHVFHALEAGAQGYLLKECAGAELIEAVRTMHGGRRYLGRNVVDIVATGLNAGRGKSPLASLSRRERQILRLVADGHSSAAVGTMLNLSPKTVDTYRSRLMQKLGVSDLAGLVKLAIQHGLTTLDSHRH